MSEVISDLYFESIKYINNNLFNIQFHLDRLNKTIKDKFGAECDVVTEADIFKPVVSDESVYKLRVVYADEIIYTEILPYKKPVINRLRIVVDNNIDYSHKNLNRDEINNLKSHANSDEDIIIIKNGFVTDSSFSNLVFFDGKNFFTPSTPLLKGTYREKLLSENKIIEKEIKLEDIKNYESVSLINAFNNLGEIAISIEDIIF